MRISDWSSDVCSSDLFGPLHQIGKQNLGQRGGIVLGRRFERMEERGYSRGSTRLLKGRNGRRLADTRYPREPLKGCRGNTPWWRRPQIERPDRIEPIKVTEELGRHALGGHCPQRVQGGERGCVALVKQGGDARALVLAQAGDQMAPQPGPRTIPDSADQSLELGRASCRERVCQYV